MYINEQKLIHLPVFTQSGEKLGHVVDIEIDLEAHMIRKYMVGTRFRKETYLITPAQIVKIDDKQIIVEDTVSKVPGEGEDKKSVLPKLDTLMPTNRS
jgi:sporulation protein YlmC with PRC-barrel domain